MAKYIIYIGIALVICGSILYFFPNAFKWLGRLPGDIRIEKENTKFYFPITTMIILSVALNIILRIFRSLQ